MDKIDTQSKSMKDIGSQSTKSVRFKDVDDDLGET